MALKCEIKENGDKREASSNFGKQGLLFYDIFLAVNMTQAENVTSLSYVIRRK